MKKLISLIIALLMLFSVVASFPASSTSVTYVIGDIDGNGRLRSTDCLRLKRIVAGEDLSYLEDAADINYDGRINSVDIANLKKLIAGSISTDSLPYRGDFLSSLSIDGVGIENYTIIFPSGTSPLPRYAAMILKTDIEDLVGVSLSYKADTAAESEYEILIGNTNRDESKVEGLTLDSDEYLLKKDGKKIVMLGEGYMVGGAVGEFMYNHAVYDTGVIGDTLDITDLPTANTPKAYTPIDAESVILMIGDGMGKNHITSSLSYNQNVQTVDNKYTSFIAEELPNKGDVTTHSMTTIEYNGTEPTDSAASATTYACGIKTYNTYLGIDENKQSYQNVRELAASVGKMNGVLTTDVITGATPSAFLVHHDNRRDAETIAAMQAKLKDVDIMEGEVGDSLTNKTRLSLNTLTENNEQGFFFMIEEAYIDKHSEKNLMKEMTLAMSRFDKAIQYAMVFASSHPDCILIVTADHETGGITNEGAFTVTNHTTANVPIFSIGKGTQALTGTIDNVEVGKFIAKTFGAESFGKEY